MQTRFVFLGYSNENKRFENSTSFFVVVLRINQTGELFLDLCFISPQTFLSYLLLLLSSAPIERGFSIAVS